MDKAREAQLKTQVARAKAVGTNSRGADANSKDTKQAPRKLPKNQPRKWGKIVFYTLALLAGVAAVTIATQLIVGYLMLWTMGMETLSTPVGSAIHSALSYSLDLCLIVVLPSLFYRKISREELGLKGLPTWTDIGLAPVGYLVYLLIAAVVVGLFSLFPWFDAGQEQSIGFSLMVVGADRVMAFLTLVVVAPIAEEIIFRGWLYGKLRRKFSQVMSEKVGLVLTIFLVSVLFGIIHLQWNVGVNVFALSIVLCLLREMTGTIYSGILLHMLKNGVAFYLLFVLGV